MVVRSIVIRVGISSFSALKTSPVGTILWLWSSLALRVAVVILLLATIFTSTSTGGVRILGALRDPAQRTHMHWSRI